MNIKKYCFLLVFALVGCLNANAQQVRHTVTKGETVTRIAERYKVTPHDIYKLNPSAQQGIRENDVLIIPPNSQSANTSQHTVKPKETLYGIAKMYNITIDELKRLNPILND